MTESEANLVASLLEAYRLLREAYWHDMKREPPALNDLQVAVSEMLAKPRD